MFLCMLFSHSWANLRPAAASSRRVLQLSMGTRAAMV